jgi:hypothetical protein
MIATLIVGQAARAFIISGTTAFIAYSEEL